MLAGTPLVSGTISTVPPGQAARIRQFGEVFDTLVTGHLCGINANSIARMLAGTTDVTAAMVSTQGVAGGPIREIRGNVSIETSEEWSVFSGDIATGMMRTSISFGEAAGGASYGGRDVYCGSVLVTDTYSGVVNGSGDIEAGLMQARAQAQFEHFATNVLPRLSDRAHTVAMSIYNGERDQTNLLTPSRAAVYEAVASYATVSGSGVDGLDDAATIATVHEELSGQVTLQGWMLAPVWQRGVAQTVGNLEMPGDTMQLAAVRENRITDFLSGRGYATDRGTTFDLLTSANIRQDTWDEIAGAVRALPPPDAAIPQTIGLGATPDVSDSVAQGLYTTILDFFSPVAMMKLVEVVRGATTSQATIDDLYDYTKRVGKVPILCKDTKGFVVNRLLIPYMLEAYRLVERGERRVGRGRREGARAGGGVRDRDADGADK
jgi:hypothetical protein